MIVFVSWYLLLGLVFINEAAKAVFQHDTRHPVSVESRDKLW